MNKTTALEQRNQWASVKAVAARFALNESTVRGWVKEIRDDPFLSVDERLSLVIGRGASTRVNVWGLFLYLENKRVNSTEICRIH